VDGGTARGGAKVTQEEWLGCSEPDKMLEALRGQAGDRQLRWFAVACCRRIWGLLDESSQAALKALEQSLNGEGGPLPWWGTFAPADRDTTTARQAALAVRYASYSRPVLAAQYAAQCAAEAGAEAAAGLAASRALRGADAVATAAATAWDAVWNAPVTEGTYLMSLRQQAWEAARDAARSAERAEQAALLRDVASPQRQEVGVNPSWLAWQDGTVPRLAQAMYESGVFGHLPVLADALEDAGCAERAILDHLRGAGPHVRGCWAVDLLLGKA
jgi:hypothetical protein